MADSGKHDTFQSSKQRKARAETPQQTETETGPVTEASGTRKRDADDAIGSGLQEIGQSGMAGQPGVTQTTMESSHAVEAHRASGAMIAANVWNLSHGFGRKTMKSRV